MREATKCFIIKIENQHMHRGVLRLICAVWSWISIGHFGKGKLMTRSQLIRRIMAETGMSSAVVEDVMDAAYTQIVQALAQGEKVSISGFGRFEMREHKSKTYTNPRTGETSHLDAMSTPAFRPSGLLKEDIRRAADK